jgi:hypothetical protein
MTEGAPKIVTQMDVMKGLRKKLGPAVSITIDTKLPPELVTNIAEAVKAFNTLSDMVAGGEEFPKTWEGLGYGPLTKFSFLKEVDGKQYKRDGSYATPRDFIKAMKEFHGLSELIGDEEKKEIEAAKAAEAYLRTPEGIRELRLKREAANEAKLADMPPVKAPVAPTRPPSPFRPRG